MKGAKKPLGFDRGTEWVPDSFQSVGIHPSWCPVWREKARRTITTDFHRRCRHAFQVWKHWLSKPWAGTNWSVLYHSTGWIEFLVNMTYWWGVFIARVGLRCQEATRGYSQMKGLVELLILGWVQMLRVHPVCHCCFIQVAASQA